MSDIEPAKLKVTELREELKKRGLDAKGNKPQLVKRLEKALAEAAGAETEAADTSAVTDADTSQVTDTSVNESQNESTAQVDTSLDNSQYATATDETPKPKAVDTTPEVTVSAPAVEEPVAPMVEEPAPEPTPAPEPNRAPEPTAAPEPTPAPAPTEVVVEKPAPVAVVDEVPATPEAMEEAPSVPTVQAATPTKSPRKQSPAVTPVKSPITAVPTAVAVSPEAPSVPVVQAATPTKSPRKQSPAVTPVKSPITAVPTAGAVSPVATLAETSETMPEADVKTEAAFEPDQPADDAESAPAESVEPMEVAPAAAAVEDVKAEPSTIAESTKTSAQEPEVIKVEDGGSEEEKPEVMDVKESDSGSQKDDSSEKRREHRKRSRSPSDDRRKSHRSRSRSPHRSSRRSRSRSAERHHQRRSRSRSHERRRSRTPEKQEEQMESDEWVSATVVQLDKYNSDLSMCIDEAGFKASPLTEDAFGFMWTGVKATYGVTTGKVCFEMKVVEHLNVDHLPAEEENRHVVRVGFSAKSVSLLLGEEKFSYGYGGTGKSSTDCKFKDYGQSFEQGDVITSYLDMTSNPVVISFAKNGEDLGNCFDVEASQLDGQALFPHVLSKNCSFECNFGQMESPFFPPAEGFVFINDIPVEERERGILPPAKKEDCEMLMMCGLPGCGKTVWAGKHIVQNPEKLYNVLGTNSIIDKMKVMGLPRKRNYHGRWDVLIDMSTKALNKLLQLAAKRKRNYILDQTNVYPSAQRRKMRPFEGFQRKAVVIVPTDEEYKSRCDQRDREEGKEIPDSAVLEMKANFQLPEVGGVFDEVQFVELQPEEAQVLVEQYNKEGRAAQPPDYKRFRGAERDRATGSRFSDNTDHGRRDYNADRGGNRDYNRPNRGSYGDNRRGGGYYNRDRDSGYSSRGGGYGDRSSGSGGYQDRRREQSAGSGGYNRERRDYRGGREGGSYSSGGSRGGGSGGGWKNQSSSSATGGSWKPHGGSASGSTGYGAQQQWGAQAWGGQDWSQQQGYQQAAGGWAQQQQWPGYGQQAQQQQTQAGWPQGYPYAAGWNQAAAASTWPAYGQQSQSWDYSGSQGQGQYHQK